MSNYQTIDRLASDPAFQARVRACMLDESVTHRADEKPEWVAMAEDVIRGGGSGVLPMTRLAAAAPGFADKAVEVTPDPLGGVGNRIATSPPGIDQSGITDEDILALVQAEWGYVAELTYQGGKT
jgi:hypothetical protein